jgi:hypothetical protein
VGEQPIHATGLSAPPIARFFALSWCRHDLGELSTRMAVDREQKPP